MEDLVISNLSFYGPLAVLILLMLSGFGVPLGEDFIIIPAGILVAAGEMEFLPTAMMAYVGVVAADFLWFGIVSRFGSMLLHKRWMRRMIHPRRLLQAKHQLDKRGAWMIVFARFIPGSRSSAITVAAMLHMKFWKFALATSTCVLLTVPLQLGLGMLVEKGIGTEETATLVIRIFGLVMLLIGLVVVRSLIQRFRRQHRGAPRARAAWLRKFRLTRRTRPAGHPTSPKQPATTDRGR